MLRCTAHRNRTGSGFAVAHPEYFLIHQGNCLDVLKTLAPESVQCVVTSPPYWGLRDYGVEGQLGSEATLDDFVVTQVRVFDEIRRVLTSTGTCWLNLGDSYGSGTAKGRKPTQTGKHGYWQNPNILERNGFAAKQLCGIPWRVAFALQAAGWYLRSDIIWSKPNPMPESVQDRPTKAHEYIFLLTKSARYYYDAAAIREPYVRVWDEKNGGTFAHRGDFPDEHACGGKKDANRAYPLPRAYTGQATKDYDAAGAQDPSDTKRRVLESMEKYAGANKRSVWTVATQPFPGAHFATFPEALIEPCILAGSRQGDVVLDPFAGAGTVGVVCQKAQRRFVGIELNPAYVAMAEARIAAVAPLFASEAVS